jgi:hypothetical protein
LASSPAKVIEASANIMESVKGIIYTHILLKYVGGIIMTAITISDVVQILQVISIVFGILIFYPEYRRSVRDRGYNTYLQTVFHLVDLEKMFIQHPELQKLWEYDDVYRNLSKNGRKRYHWCSILIDVFEIVYLASPHQRKWITKEEWEGWEQLISEIATNNQEFHIAWETAKNMYSEKFTTYMDDKLASYQKEKR